MPSKADLERFFNKKADDKLPSQDIKAVYKEVKNVTPVQEKAKKQTRNKRPVRQRKSNPQK